MGSAGHRTPSNAGDTPPAFAIPAEHLVEAEDIPDFWVSTVDGVLLFLRQRFAGVASTSGVAGATRRGRGRVETLGRTAGGRDIQAVCYGAPRAGHGTTTFSGALGAGAFGKRAVGAYRGPNHKKLVYTSIGGVHGGEFEGIVGLVNLIAVLETGADLRGKAWPGITATAARLDRMVLVPVVNLDGRARVPIQMEAFRGRSNHVHEYFNCGAWPDGSLIGWPGVKRHIPLDFAQTQFPGGYPNDAGVNLMHDDFFGARQPETQALLDFVARERPDLLLNMHTGVAPRDYYARMHRPFTEPGLAETFDALYTLVHTALTRAGLQGSPDEAVEADRRPGAGAAQHLQPGRGAGAAQRCALRGAGEPLPRLRRHQPAGR